MRPSRSAPNFHTLHTDHTPFGTRATNDLEEVDRGESLVSGLVMVSEDCIVMQVLTSSLLYRSQSSTDRNSLAYKAS